MFDRPVGAPGLDDVRALVAAFARVAVPADDPARVDLIRALEEVQAAAAAAQARVVAAFAASQRAAQVAAGVPAARVGQGVAAQVGLARRQSPARTARYLALAATLTDDLAHTYAALAEGRVSEWRALLVARETAWLTPAQRAAVDAQVGPQLEQWGDRRVEAETRRAAYRLDPAGFVARARNAETDRHVSLRPAPDTMSRLCALLPVAQGVAVLAALRAAADTHQAGGDPRGRGQVMADTLVTRITGQASPDAIPVQVNLLMPADTLLAGGDEPAELPGHGPLPAPHARELTRTAAIHAQAWIRRLYTRPDTGHLLAMDSRRRTFPPGLAAFLLTRDRTCRTPWCDAPIRHLDHVIPHAAGGPTTAANGQGTCERCNHTKQAPGWHTRPGQAGAGEDVQIRTPTGHTYTSHPPDPPRSRPRSPGVDPPSPIEHALQRLLSAA